MKQEDYFFIIDSTRLEETVSGLYGFCLTEKGIIFPDDMIRPEDIAVTGLGSYDLILRDTDTITILQDALGSQGVYLYQDGDYFALSNSDLYLMEYLKTDGRHPFSLDYDYACHLIPRTTGVHACSETIINEICYLSRDLKIIIDLKDRGIRYERVDWQEDTIAVDTEEGLALLDKWMERWCSVIRSVYAAGGNIEFDLSGGFDSRLSILVGLNAGIDMSSVMVRSLNDGLFCHDEDYRIASMIAQAYGFDLNNTEVFTYQDTPFTIPEILGISMYTKGFSHKQMYYKLVRHSLPKYRVTGAGGENRRRDKANRQPDEILNICQKEAKQFFSEHMRDAALEAEKRVIERAVSENRASVCGREDSISEEDISRRLWMDSRWRYHFAKDMFECLPANEIKLLPMLDPELMKLKRRGERGDADLLIALIFVRYGEKMLEIPFEGGRGISGETIDYARELCERYPLKKMEQTALLKREKRKPYPGNTCEGRRTYSEEQAFHAARLLAASPCIRDHFCRVFDEDTYYLLTEDSFVRKFRPLQMLHGILAVGIADLYAETSKKGNSVTFPELAEKPETDGYVELTEQMLRSAAEKQTVYAKQIARLKEADAKILQREKKIASLQKELDDIRNSKRYRTASAMAKVYRKLPFSKGEET